jgi:hypothetical protein
MTKFKRYGMAYKEVPYTWVDKLALWVAAFGALTGSILALSLLIFVLGA